MLRNIPSVITVRDALSRSPVDIGVFSRSPLGYRCVWFLIGYEPARLAPSRLISDSCSSAHGFTPCFLPTPSRSCTSFRSLWSARGRTFTSKIAPMLGAHILHALKDGVLRLRRTG
ncbi:AcaB family transcriptional regulator [Escherichia coli]